MAFCSLERSRRRSPWTQAKCSTHRDLYRDTRWKVLRRSIHLLSEGNKLAINRTSCRQLPSQRRVQPNSRLRRYCWRILSAECWFDPEFEFKFNQKIRKDQTTHNFTSSCAIIVGNRSRHRNESFDFVVFLHALDRWIGPHSIVYGKSHRDEGCADCEVLWKRFFNWTFVAKILILSESYFRKLSFVNLIFMIFRKSLSFAFFCSIYQRWLSALVLFKLAENPGPLFSSRLIFFYMKYFE